MPSPTLIAFAEKDSGTTQIANGVGESTATLTWQTNDLLLALAANAGASPNDTFNVPTNTGTGLAWSQVVLHAASSDTGLGCWVATANAAGSGVVTITNSTGVASDNLTVAAAQWRPPTGYTLAVGGSKLTLDQSNATNGATNVAALAMTATDSAVLWFVNDWGANSIANLTPSPTPTTHSATTPGPTALPFSLTISGQYTVLIDVLDDEPSSGTINFGEKNAAALTSPLLNILAVEIAMVAISYTVPTQDQVAMSMMGARAL